MKKYLNKEYLKELFIITFGNFLVAVAFSFFLDPNNLVIGGATGLATIFKNLFEWDTAISVFVINGVLLLIGLFFLGKEFFIKTLYSSVVLPIMISFCNLLHDALVHEGEILVNDQALVIIFSSLIMGLGIGLVMRKGATTGGTEIPQKLLYKYCYIPYSVSLYLIDGVIVVLGSILLREPGQMMDINKLLYAIIFIYVSGLVIDQIVFSGFNSRAVHIISSKSEEIKKRILEDFERGVSEVKIVGGYTKEEKTKLICILSSSEFYRLKGIIHEVDPLAFFYVVRANEVSGEGFTRK